MDTAMKLLVLKRGGVFAYLLNDTFPTVQAAPMAATTASNPGPGILAKGTDSANRASINSTGELVIVGAAANNFIDPGYYFTDGGGNGFLRAPGRTVVYKSLTFLNSTSRGLQLGWQTSASPNTVAGGGVYFEAGAAIRAGSLNEPPVAAWALSVTYDVAIVEYSAGYSMFIKGGAFTTWTLLFTKEDGANATLWPQISGVSNTDCKLGGIIIRDIPAPMRTLYGLATVNVTNPTNGAVVTAAADGEFSVYFTLPGSPSADQVAVDLQFNWTDATHYNSAQIKRNAGNTAWDFVKAEYAGAGATNVVTVTGVGTPIELRVRKIANKQRYSTKTGTTWTGRSTEQTVTNEQNSTGLNVTFNGATVSQLVSIPITHNTYDAILDGL